MPHTSLQNVIEQLEQQGELVRVSTPVSPHLEITEIVDRLSKSSHSNKVVLFENTGSEFPLLINLYGSQRRMEYILGVDNLDDIATEIVNWFEWAATPPGSLWEKIKRLSKLKTIAQWLPKHTSRKGDSQAIIMSSPDLSRLPVLTCWPGDAAPFITLPSVHTISPTTGQRNVGMYRMQVLDKQTTAMHWHMHKGGAAHYEEYKRLKKKMPVAVTLGGDPIYTYVATAPLPEGIDEYLLAGFLRKKPVELCKCITQDIEVPVDVDIVIEGYIDPQEPLVKEGPFGDHTGYYSLPDFYPSFHVTAITYRKNAIYPTTIVGIPPQEDAWIGKTTERIFLPLLQKTSLPELIDMDMPFWGVAHNLVIASIDNRFPGSAHKLAHHFWGAGQMAFNKTLIVVDKTVNVHNPSEVLNAVFNNVEIEKDILFSSGMLDVLDHAAPQKAFGGKCLIDATATHNASSSKTIDKLTWDKPFDFFAGKGYPFHNHFGLIIQTPSSPAIEEIEKWATAKPYKIIILIDTLVVPHEANYLLWQLLNNIDVERDIKYINNNHTLLINATRKTNLPLAYDAWPNMVKMENKIIELVDKKWPDYQLGDFIESPSKRFSFLNDVTISAIYNPQ